MDTKRLQLLMQFSEEILIQLDMIVSEPGDHASSYTKESLAEACWQCLANICVQNSFSRDAVWTHAVPKAITLALSSKLPKVRTAACMFVHICTRDSAQLLEKICSCHPGIAAAVILHLEMVDVTSAAKADTDWAIFFVETLVASAHLQTFMQAVAQPMDSHLQQDMCDEQQKQPCAFVVHKNTRDKEAPEYALATQFSTQLESRMQDDPPKDIKLQASARGIQIKTCILRFLEARLSSPQVAIILDGKSSWPDEHAPPSDSLSLSSQTLQYIQQKFQQLAYLVRIFTSTKLIKSYVIILVSLPYAVVIFCYSAHVGYKFAFL